MFSFQVLVTVLILQYLGSSIVLGRPRTTYKTRDKGGMHGRLRDKFSEVSLGKLIRLLRMPSSNGSHVKLDEAGSNIRHLQRIKRDIYNNPCFKHGSFRLISLSDGTKTHSVKCKPSTITGCFHVAKKFTTSKCTEVRVFYSSTGQSVVQDCSCAS